MSFKIFSLQLLGKIKPVEKIEIQRKNLWNDYQEFLQVENSDELKEYLDLEKFIQSAEFVNRKKEIQRMQFKGSKEEKLLKEFEQLKKAGHIKKYFKLKDSPQLKRFITLKGSDKLKEYHQLKEYVENGNFSKEKEEMHRLVFKGSVEQSKEKEYNKLKKQPGIKIFYELHQSEILKRHDAISHTEKLKKYLELKNISVADKEKKHELKKLKNDNEIKSYLKLEHSKKLKLYRETADSYNLKRFEELKVEIESEAFKKRIDYLKDKKKFEKTEAFKNWSRFKELASSDDIKFFLKFEKSPQLDNYYKVADSADLKRFNELSSLIASEDFLKRKAYLEDSKKWGKSEEYAREQKYLEMKKRPHLVKYFKYKGTDAFDFYTYWDVSFEDAFQGGKLDVEKWSTLSPWADKAIGRNYSLPGDLHVYTNGENITCESKLVIETRKEKVDGMIWKMSAGFIPAEFDYTSGLVSTAKSFRQEDGIFEAKIKFNPVKETVSSFVLQGEKAYPGIYLLEMGAKNRIGISSQNEKGKLTINGLDISNLKKGKWYIFTLEKSDNSLVWKINETEVLRLENRHIDFPLHISLFSLVISQVPGSLLPVRFQTEWIKCYKKK
ncbi:MAG: hypothetical protein K0B11_00750 [Mariniphaga sp.]|nr:hypothetical protein [Mariniphaga sp.]